MIAWRGRVGRVDGITTKSGSPRLTPEAIGALRLRGRRNRGRSTARMRDNHPVGDYLQADSGADRGLGAGARSLDQDLLAAVEADPQADRRAEKRSLADLARAG